MIAIRSGKYVGIPVYDVVVGDILHSASSDVISADDVLVSGYRVRCDESFVLGLSGQVNKTSGDEIMAGIKEIDSIDRRDSFIVSGSEVLRGFGTYLVMAVAVHSVRGASVDTSRDNAEATTPQ